MRRLPLMLLAATALAACADESARREFIYKPAYCLASGLANMGGEACLPQALKDKANAVASARLQDAVAEKPSQELRVYYTPDQRAGMSYAIARALFAPDKTTTRAAVTMSLEAAGILDPAESADTTCGGGEARRDVVNFVRRQMTNSSINRDTADFLAEHYTDLQLTELYRVAREGGTLADLADDAFLLPDPKNPGKRINVKPRADRRLGGIISYSTSRVASRIVQTQRKEIAALAAERRAARRAETCPPPAAPEPTKEQQP